MRVLSSETKDQLAERALERRPPRPSLLVGPAASDELAVPRSKVSGLNEKAVQAGRASDRLSAANSARSACVTLGRVPCRRRIANSCRRTRISSSFERRGRARSHTSANKLRTTRYTNDQSKQPSLDHGKKRRT